MGVQYMLKDLSSMFDRVGLFWVGLIFAFIIINLYFLMNVLIVTWYSSEFKIVVVDGFIKGGDFIALWPALKLAVAGQAELAYDKNAIQIVQHQLTGIDTWADRRFLHPPTYLFMLFPLGELSYFTALAVWQVLPIFGFLLVMSRMGIPWALFFLLPLSGAVVQNIAAGQNGSLSAFFLAGALLTLERRPSIAGVLFGLMTFKPQLALLIAPTLLVGRQWHALKVMIVTVLAGIAVSMAAFGIEPWVVFFRNLFFAQGQLAQGHLPWQRIPSAFVAARMIGLDATLAQTVQGVVAVVAFAGVAWAWWRPIRFHLKAALLGAAIPLATPWIHDYDLVILLVPMAWLILDTDREPIRILEIVFLTLTWMFPAVWIIQLLPVQGFPYGFLLLLAFYGIVMCRILRFIQLETSKGTLP
jgi:hypothetical protein